MKNNLNDLIKKTSAFKVIFDSVPLHIVITDPDGKVVIANKAVEKITGFTAKEIIGNNPRLWGRQMDKSFYKNFWKEIKENKNIFSGIVENKKKNGIKYYASVKVTPILDNNDSLIGFCGIEQDITEIQKLSDEHDLTRVHRDMLKRLAKIN